MNQLIKDSLNWEELALIKKEEYKYCFVSIFDHWLSEKEAEEVFEGKKRKDKKKYLKIMADVYLLLLKKYDGVIVKNSYKHDQNYYGICKKIQIYRYIFSKNNIHDECIYLKSKNIVLVKGYDYTDMIISLKTDNIDDVLDAINNKLSILL